MKKELPIIVREQYEIVAQRRQARDSLLWSVPSIASAALALLLGAAFDPSAAPRDALLFSTISVVVAFASLQLMAKNRYLEMADSSRLGDYERHHGLPILHGKDAPMPPKGPLEWLKSYWVWFFALLCLFITAIYATGKFFDALMSTP